MQFSSLRLCTDRVTYTHTHTHTHIYIYIYILKHYVSEAACASAFRQEGLNLLDPLDQATICHLAWSRAVFLNFCETAAW